MAVKYAGVDISAWQTNVDYNKLKNATIAGSKNKFVFIRCAYGTTEDKMFKKHVEGCIKAGLNVGLYLYSIARTPAAAKKEAEFVISLIKKYNLDGKITYPIAYDLEEESIAKLGKNLCTSLVLSFCDTIKSYNYYPIVYTNFNWLYWAKNIDRDEIVKAGYEFWIAGYIAQSRTTAYKKDISIWQHSVAGHPSFDIAGIKAVDGVAGQCDCNWSYVAYASKIKKLGMNKFKPKKYNLTVKANGVTVTVRNKLSAILRAMNSGAKFSAVVRYNCTGTITDLSEKDAESRKQSLQKEGFQVVLTEVDE